MKDDIKRLKREVHRRIAIDQTIKNLEYLKKISWPTEDGRLFRIYV